MNFDSYRIAENMLFITGQHVTSTHQQTSWKKIYYFQSKSLLSISKISTHQTSNTTPQYLISFHLEMQSSCLNVEFLFTAKFIKCHVFSTGDRTLATSLEEIVGVFIHFFCEIATVVKMLCIKEWWEVKTNLFLNQQQCQCFRFRSDVREPCIPCCVDCCAGELSPPSALGECAICIASGIRISISGCFLLCGKSL